MVQILACRRPGDKPLSEPMIVSLLTHICVTRPQWVKGMGTIVATGYSFDSICGAGSRIHWTDVEYKKMRLIWAYPWHKFHTRQDNWMKWVFKLIGNAFKICFCVKCDWNVRVHVITVITNAKAWWNARSKSVWNLCRDWPPNGFSLYCWGNWLHGHRRLPWWLLIVRVKQLELLHSPGPPATVPTVEMNHKKALQTGMDVPELGRSRRHGQWFNIKMSSYQYRKSHCEDKTILRSFYLHYGNSYTGKTGSLYWFSPMFSYIIAYPHGNCYLFKWCLITMRHCDNP